MFPKDTERLYFGKRRDFLVQLGGIQQEDCGYLHDKYSRSIGCEEGLCLTELCFSNEVGIKEGAEGFRV